MKQKVEGCYYGMVASLLMVKSVPYLRRETRAREREREREREGEKVISCILHRLATTNEGSKQASKEMKM